MSRISEIMSHTLRFINSRNGQMVVLVLVLVLFVLSAGAPNAMGGIGK